MNQGYLNLFLTPNYKSKMEVKQREGRCSKKNRKGRGEYKGSGRRERAQTHSNVCRESISLLSIASQLVFSSFLCSIGLKKTVNGRNVALSTLCLF